jgi:hypothetical protein
VGEEASGYRRVAGLVVVVGLIVVGLVVVGLVVVVDPGRAVVVDPAGWPCTGGPRSLSWGRSQGASQRDPLRVKWTPSERSCTPSRLRV